MGDKRDFCTVKACEEIVENFFKSSNKVNRLLSDIPSRPTISCQDCSQTATDINQTTRAAIRDTFPLEIVLCCNRLKGDDIEEVLVHELIHAYDYSKNRCDFSTCKGLAFTEVRAAREAECSKGFFPFEFMRKSCIRDCAIRSTANLFPRSESTICVDAVISDAMNDLEPFSTAVTKE